jgi:hypothetical protein
MGGGIPSTSTIPMSGLTSSGVGVPFGWNIPSGFGVVPSQDGGSSMSGGFNFPWVSTPFPGGTSLGVNFHSGRLSLYQYLGSGGFFPGTNFGNIFPLGSTPIPGGNPLGGMSGLGRSHAPGSATIPRGTHSLGTPQPSSSMNVGGPQGSSGTTRDFISLPVFIFSYVISFPHNVRLT